MPISSAENKNQGYKYVAFISYSHKDEKIAKWLQRKLEAYKLPTEIQNEIRKSRYLRPVFRDTSDLNTGILTEELNNHLRLSKFLIVICSPNSAHSAWVSDEVRTFIESGRLSNIIPVIIDGELCGNEEKECLPTFLKNYLAQFPEKELLCIDLRECGREKAFIRVVSYIIGVDFDSLWHRYKRDALIRMSITALSAIVFITAMLWLGNPISLRVSMSDEPCDLPEMRDPVLKIGDIEYSISNADTVIVHELPGYMRLRRIPISFSATYYKSTDTVVRLNCNVHQNVEIELFRDSTFAVYAGMIVDENYEPVSGVLLKTEDGTECISDENGKFHISVPLDKQKEIMGISLSKEGYIEFIREDECPSSNIIYKLSNK